MFKSKRVNLQKIDQGKSIHENEIIRYSDSIFCKISEESLDWVKLYDFHKSNNINGKKSLKLILEIEELVVLCATYLPILDFRILTTSAKIFFAIRSSSFLTNHNDNHSSFFSIKPSFLPLRKPDGSLISHDQLRIDQKAEFFLITDKKENTNLSQLSGHASPIFKERIEVLCISPDGNTMFTYRFDQESEGENSFIKSWDLNTGIENYKISVRDCNIVPNTTISNDSKYIIISWICDDLKKKKSKIYNVFTGQEMFSINSFGHKPSFIFSYDSNFIAAKSNSSLSIDVWDIEKRTQVAFLSGHKESISYFDICKNSKKIIATSVLGKILIWDLMSSKLINEITYHKCKEIEEIKFGNNNNQFYLYIKNEPLILWDISNKTSTIVDYISKGEYPSLDVVKKIIFLRGKYKVKERITNYDSKNGFVRCSSFPENKYLFDYLNQKVITLHGKKIIVWDVNSYEFFSMELNHDDIITDIDIVPTKNQVVSSSLDGTLKFWDYMNKKLVMTIRNRQINELKNKTFKYDSVIRKSSEEKIKTPKKSNCLVM